MGVDSPYVLPASWCKGFGGKQQISQQECSQRSERTGLAIVLDHNVGESAKFFGAESLQSPFFDTRLSSESVSSRILFQRSCKAPQSTADLPTSISAATARDKLPALQTKRGRPQGNFSTQKAQLVDLDEQELLHTDKKFRPDSSYMKGEYSGLANLASACARVEAIDTLADLLKLELSGSPTDCPKMKGPSAAHKARQKMIALLRRGGLVKKRRLECA